MYLNGERKLFLSCFHCCPCPCWGWLLTFCPIDHKQGETSAISILYEPFRTSVPIDNNPPSSRPSHRSPLDKNWRECPPTKTAMKTKERNKPSRKPVLTLCRFFQLCSLGQEGEMPPNSRSSKFSSFYTKLQQKCFGRSCIHSDWNYWNLEWSSVQSGLRCGDFHSLSAP